MHTLQPNIPDHNSQQQLGLSHSLLLVSAAPGHFVWSHQWHQICTAERQPLVGGRQGRGQQQWPAWTLFLRSLEFCTLAICSSYFKLVHFVHCNQSSWLTDWLQLFLFLLLSLPTSLAITHMTDSVWIWLVGLGGQGTVLRKPVQACCCQQIIFAVHMFKLTQLMQSLGQRSR